MRARSCWPVLVMLVLTACGSTATTGRPGTPAAGAALTGGSAPGADGLGTDLGSTPARGTGSGSAPLDVGLSAAAPQQADGAPNGLPQGGTPQLTAAQEDRPTVRTSGRGFTADTITIGYAYSSDLNSIYTTYNISGESPGDTRAQMEALARWVNAQGGIAGRKLEYVPYDLSAADVAAGNQAQLAEEACTTWTQDNQVFAVVQPLLGTSELRACLAKRDTPLIGHGDGAFLDESEYRRYASYLYDPGTMSTQTLWPAWVRTLVGGGYFTGWDAARGAPANAPVKIGLLHPDNVDANKSAAVLKESLARAGYPVAEEFAYQGSLQGSSSGNQAAVMQFKGKGVTHVISPNLLFLQAASNQDYRPRYSFAANANVLAQNAPQNSLTGAMAAGSSPAQDVDAAHDPGTPSKQAVLCEKVMAATREDTRSGRTILSNMRRECDAIFLLKAALDPATGGPSTAALRTGVEALGSTLPSAQTWLSAWGPGQHASGRALRLLVHEDACSCFTYRGPLVTVR